MADESQQSCVMCHEPNQQMLMLSCVHDPCVNCAATHYVENEPHNSPIYTCAKCGQETQLDESSIGELRRIYGLLKNKKKSRNPPSTISQKDRSQKRDYNNSYHDREPYYPKTRNNEPVSSVSRKKEVEQIPSSKYYAPNPVSQPSYTSGGSKHSSYQPTYPCKDHQEEQLTYFCFTCNRPICPQCAIHGSHRDHQVETTRKAIKHIRQLLVEDKQKLEAQLNSLGSNRDSAKKLSKEWVDSNKRDQDCIRKKIAQLRTVISEKERELLRSTQVNLQKNSQILRYEANASDKALQNLMGVARAIDNTLKKDELTTLHEFNKRDEETNQAIEAAERDKDKLRQQQIKNPLKALELELFEQDLDRIIGELQNLKLSATPLKA